jgi:glutamate formiminotransferase / formiminotetrahydrofolate cyclodeaminase
MKQIVECIANFSEGRRLDVVQQIVQAIAAVKDTHVLKHESDADHNRSVITFVGTPESIVESAFQAIKTAAEHIDLDVHEGEHPRLGATDVVPFVPIQGVTMDDCVALAQQLGKRVGEELSIPVYLYEKAATRPDRINLAKVRRGQYEKLKQEIGINPDRKPDFGPAQVGKAGATIIGARVPLVAYNVYLNTDDAEIARKVGLAVRGSSGGLRSVKALGMLVDGKAQVSMNLVDTTDTPVHMAVELIRREAARYGVNVESSELIGLIPQQALNDAAQWYLQLDNFTPEQVLETQVAEAMQAGARSDPFLDALASGEPAPGGGSAAAHSGAMAAALVAMVARLTVGKRKYAEVEERMTIIIDEAEQLRGKLQASVQTDAEAFNGIMAAFRLPKSSDEEKATRSQAIQDATHHAAEVPLETARMAGQVLGLAVEVAEAGNVNAVSDAGSAGALAQAAIHASGLNVKINATGVKDKDRAQGWLETLAGIEQQAKADLQRLHATIHERGGI